MPFIPVSLVVHLALTSIMSVTWAVLTLRLFRIGHAAARRWILAAAILLPVGGFITHLIYPQTCTTRGGLSNHLACLTSSALGTAGTVLLSSSLAVALSQALVAWAAQRKVVQSSVSLDSSEWDAPDAGVRIRRAVDELETETGMRLTVRITCKSGICCTVGAARPAILVSEDLCGSLDQAEIKAALAHEVAHIVRHDTGIGWASALFKALTFFSPAGYWGVRLYMDEREKAADDLAALITHDPLALASAIVKVARASATRPLLAANAAGARVGRITERVQRLLDSSEPGDSEESRRLPLVVAAIVGLVLITIFAC